MFIVDYILNLTSLKIDVHKSRDGMHTFALSKRFLCADCLCLRLISFTENKAYV